ARRQAHLEAVRAARGEQGLGPGDRGDRARANRRRVVPLKRRVHRRSGRIVAEDAAEDLDLRLPHGRPDVLHRGVLLAPGKAPLGDGGLERAHDGSGVADCRAGHVQAENANAGCNAHRNVSSAIAGEQVMPRPPGPVTRTTPGATCERWYKPAAATT